MDSRDNSKFIPDSDSNKQQQKQQQQQQQSIQQHQDEGNHEMDHHLIVSGLYDDDEAHTRKSSISFDKIKQISLTYSLQSEDDPQGTSNDIFDQHCRAESGLGTASNEMVNDGRRESSGSNHFCLSQSADGDASDTASSRKLSVIELKTIKQQPQVNSENLFSKQRDSANNDLEDVDEQNINSINEQANSDGNNNYYESDKVLNSLDKVEGNFFTRNTVPSYLRSNPFLFDQSDTHNLSNGKEIGLNENKNNNGNASRNHNNIGGTSNASSNNIEKLTAIGGLNEQNNITEAGQLSSTRRVDERNIVGISGGDGEIYSRPQYYRDVAEDIQIGKVVSRHTRRHRQHQQHESHDQSAVSRRAISESTGLRQRGSERDALVVGDDATLIMANEIGTSTNIVGGVNCSPRRKQLPHTNSNSPAVSVAAAVLAMNQRHQQQQQQQLPTPAIGGYPQRDHHVSGRTMMVHRPQQQQQQQQQQYGQLLPPLPSMQQLNSMLRSTEHSRSSSQDHIVARASRSSTGPGSERSSTTNGSSTGLKLKQHNNSISLVLFNKTDANIIISDEPSESCSEESCWGSSLPPNISIGLDRNTGIDNSLALGHQGEANDDDAGVEGNDYLSEEDLVNCSNEMFHHDASLNRDKNTTLLRGVSAGTSGFISGVDSNSRLTAAPMMTPRVLNQRLDSMARNHQNHRNQHRMFNVEKFVDRPISQLSKTTRHTDRGGQELVANISVNHPDNHESLIFESQRQQQQNNQQSSSSLSSTINETSLNNCYRHQLPGANQVRNNNIAYSIEDNQGSPQFFGNSSSSQSPLGIDMQPMSAAGRSKDNFNLIGGGPINANTGRNLSGSRDQTKRDIEDRGIRMLNDAPEHSLARDEIIIKKNIHETQPNTQVGYMFDENVDEHFGSVRQSPIIIDHADANSNRINKSELRSINNIQQQQYQNMNMNNKLLQYSNHSMNQARGNGGTTISLYNNIANRRHLSSSQVDQIDHSSLYEFDGEDDDYAYSTNSVYASPIHLSRKLHAKDLLTKAHRDDSRRVNIVISSPQRYVRPTQTRRMRVTGKQFRPDAIPKSTPQDYLYFNGSQNFPSNGESLGRRPISEVHASRLTQMDYRHSSPSPVGSQSGWSSYGSINRDNNIVGSQFGNIYDESTQQKLAQLQNQQQKNSKQQHASTNYYQTDEFAAKLSNEMILPQHSSTYSNGDNGYGEGLLDDTLLTNQRKSGNISHEFRGRDCFNSLNKSTQQQQKQQQQQLIGRSCSVPKADLSGSNVASSEKNGLQINKDRIEIEVSNKLIQQSDQQSRTTQQQQQNLSGAADISSKSSAIQAK